MESNYSEDIIALKLLRQKQKLANPRADLVAISMPVKFTSQREERQNSRKRRARVLYQSKITRYQSQVVTQTKN